MKTYLRYIFFISTVALSSCKNRSQDTSERFNAACTGITRESVESFNARMEWWRDAGFGMFIHWGPYAVPAGVYKGNEVNHIGEWIMNNAHIPIAEYEEYAKSFNPVNFNAEDWAIQMKNFGVKYVVFTSKHHDGFSMWDSKVSQYDIKDFSIYGKDIINELSVACKKEGIKFGLYYSIMDWHHPHAQSINFPNYNSNDSLRINPEFNSYFTDYLKPQLKELIQNYDPEILWFDGEWIPDYTHQMGMELYQYLRTLKPTLIINNRIDKGRQGMQGLNKQDAEYVGDFGTPEQEILKTSTDTDWESCMTMNDTWGYKSNDQNWKSSKVLIHNLIDVASKGGNYLLNIGPKADGEIPAESLGRLNEIGNWLNTNGEAIYGTENLKTHFSDGDSIRYTKKRSDEIIYAIISGQLNQVKI